MCCEETKTSQTLKNCLCNKRGIVVQWANFWLKFRIYRTKWILFLMRTCSKMTDCSHLPAKIQRICHPLLEEEYESRRVRHYLLHCTRTIRSVQQRWCSGFRYKMGSSTLLSASEIPTEIVLEDFFTSKFQDSVQIQTVLTVCEQDNIRKNEQPSNSRLMTAVRRHVDQANEDKNLQSLKRNSGGRSSNQESQRKESQRVNRTPSHVTYSRICTHV